MNILEEMEQTRSKRVQQEEERAALVEVKAKTLPGEVKSILDKHFVWPMSPEPFFTSLTEKEALVNYLLEIKGQESNAETEKQDSKFIEQNFYGQRLNPLGDFPKNAFEKIRNNKTERPKPVYLENLELF